MTKDKNNNGDNLSGEDKRLWDFVTRSIRPLDKREAKRAAPPSPPPRKPEVESEAFRLSAWRIPVFGLKPAPTTTPGSSVEPGIDRRTADRLKRGEFRIDARLDLHGLRQGEAQDQLMRFLMRSYDAGHRCVLVITGKGSGFQHQDGAYEQAPGEQAPGVLRRLLPVWIGMAPLAQMILMHSRAISKDGGDGAFYILLRRRR